MDTVYRTSCGFFLTLLAMLWLGPAKVRAQAPPPKPAPAPTLAAALASARPVSDTVVLAVDAAQVALPEGTAPPEGEPRVEAIAQAYGRTAKVFGAVTAVAPPTMTLLNPDPHDPNIYLGMEPSDVFTLLAASLDDAQWQALTGTLGLGFPDLGSDDQRQLFTALFPGGKLVVQPSLRVTPALVDEMFAAMAEGNMEKARKDFEERQRQGRRDLTGELPGARLRLGQDVRLSLPTAGKPDRTQLLGPEMMPNAPPADEIVRDEQFKPKDELFGVPVRATVPVALKDGDLDFSSPAFKAPIALGGLRTVGDLVARVGSQARTELYADPRWEHKPLTLLSGAAFAPGSDLLRALAFCLTGTFRRVGPAYVLTADAVGVGTIHRRWALFEADAREKAAVPVADAADRLFAARSPGDLAEIGGPLGLSPAQIKGFKFDAAGSWDRNASQKVPFNQLTPAQQNAARGFVTLTTQLTERFKAMMQSHPEMAGGLPDLPTLQGDVSLETRPVVQLILPSQSAPLELLSLDTRTLFNPSNKRRALLSSPAKPVPVPAVPKRTVPARPSLKEVLTTIRRRVILAGPRTPAAVDTLVAQMKTLGLNELWLDVFSAGQAHFAAGTAPPSDVLAEALRAAQGMGIRVLAVMDLFDWGGNAPAGLLDRSILGETPAETAQRQKLKAPSEAFVSPFAPEVGGTLLSVVRALTDRPGVAGLVWRGVVTPPGYAPPSSLAAPDDPLGYADPARLAFLRAAHADPLDVPGLDYLRANTSLPGFDDDAVATGLRTRWDQTRADAHMTLLRSLRAAAAPTMAHDREPFIYVKQGSAFHGGEDWFGSWDGPRAPLPAFHYAWELPQTPGQPSNPERPAVAQAKAQSRVSLFVFPAGSLASPDAASWIQGTFKGAAWDGLVIDAGTAADADFLAKAVVQAGAP